MDNQALPLKNHDRNEQNPMVMFKEWLSQAEKSEPNDPTAMAFASVDEAGMPNVRMVLMRRYDERGFCFFTNFESAKGQELLATPKGAAVFHWKSLRKQIRIRGAVVVVSDEEADEYFNSRPRGSRIGAYASKQSRPLESRFALEKAVASYAAKFGTREIPRPDYWSGFRLVPTEIEFWSDGNFRLHDRKKFSRKSDDLPWEVESLYP